MFIYFKFLFMMYGRYIILDDFGAAYRGFDKFDLKLKPSLSIERAKKENLYSIRYDKNSFR